MLCLHIDFYNAMPESCGVTVFEFSAVLPGFSSVPPCDPVFLCEILRKLDEDKCGVEGLPSGAAGAALHESMQGR